MIKKKPFHENMLFHETVSRNIVIHFLAVNGWVNPPHVF